MNPHIFVASHIPYSFPKDELYIPIQVGASNSHDLWLGGEKDNTGDNISHKNKGFCELTGIYWAWRNYKSSEPIGFVHYRRYFGKRDDQHSLSDILTKSDVMELLNQASVILPSQRNYVIETVESQYAHAHHAKDLELTRKVLLEKHPAYVNFFDNRMKRKRTHLFNMFIMKRSIFDRYCAWLFDVLFEVEKNLDTSSYSPKDKRVFGYLGERLLDVWLDTTGIPYTETSIIYLEKTNWLKKGASFLARKCFGKAFKH